MTGISSDVEEQQQVSSQFSHQNNTISPLFRPLQTQMMESATTDLPLLANQSSEVCVAGDMTAENTLFGCFYILVFFLALNGNALALWIFSHQRGSSSPANVFLVHLAVADLSYVVVLPLRATYHLTGGHWPFGEVPCRLAGFLF